MVLLFVEDRRLFKEKVYVYNDRVIAIFQFIPPFTRGMFVRKKIMKVV